MYNRGDFRTQANSLSMRYSNKLAGKEELLVLTSEQLSGQLSGHCSADS